MGGALWQDSLARLGKDKVMERYWETQGYYGFEHKWEMVTTDATKELALDSLRTYRDNEPSTSFRIKMILVKG